MRVVAAMTVFCILGSGCGTLRNVSKMPFTESESEPPRKEIYGGVLQDVNEIKSGVNELRNYSETKTEFLENSGRVVLNGIDAPLSFVGDTLTLPVTFPASIERAVKEHYHPDKLNAMYERQNTLNDKPDNNE